MSPIAQVLTAGLTCLVMTSIFAPAALWFARRAGLLDVPNSRSSHQTPIPRGGGIACIAGGLAAAGVGEIIGLPRLLPLAGVAAVCGLIGLSDDRWNLPARWRLIAQLLFGALAGVLAGDGWLALTGAIVFAVGINAVNFMDGINGLTCFTMVVWGAAVIYAGILVGQPTLCAVGVMAMTSGTAFLPWNIPSARIFLGDAGSYFFGALVASGVLLGYTVGASSALLVAPLSVHLADVSITLIKRALRRAPLTQAHREHVYQRLVSERGFSHTAVSAFVAAVGAGITTLWIVVGGVGAGIATTLLLAAYALMPLLGRRIHLSPEHGSQSDGLK